MPLRPKCRCHKLSVSEKSSKKQKLMSLIVAHDIQLLFLCETFLHTEVMTSQVMQCSHFKEIGRTDRNKGELGVVIDYLLFPTQNIQQKLLISQYQNSANSALAV